MSAAFELTRPEHRGRYQVTIYQQGWRLGGKGASGRGPADRIEEHGLHLWMGWYENAFSLMRQCYRELDRDPRTCRLAEWTDAFKPAHFVGTIEKNPEGGWQYWKAFFPPGHGLPGDPVTASRRFTLPQYMARSLTLVRALLRTLRAHEEAGPTDSDPAQKSAGAERTGFSPEALADLIARLSGFGEMATLTALSEAVSLLEAILERLSGSPENGTPERLSSLSENTVLRFLDALGKNARAGLEGLALRSPEVRRLWTIIDLTTATMRGILRSGLLRNPNGFDAIDDYDCREWLLLNGASEQSVHSSFMNGLYDLGFSYEEGDSSRPRIAAGQALRSTIRALFTYRGAFFWKMQSGMGDVVFAPLYEVLRRRGARFEFFHRLANVKLANQASLNPGERQYVEALDFEVQAQLRPDPVTGEREYRPLIDVRGLPCWPAHPLYEQLRDGESLRERNFESFWDHGGEGKTLRVVEDFDLVVLGVPVGVIPHVCSELVATNPRWRTMVEHVKTVATQAFQIWMRPDMSELGWRDEPINVSGFVEPFDTWADMRHLIPDESWPAEHSPRSIAYFCNALSDLEPTADRKRSDYVAAQRERVRGAAVRFLNQDVVHLWPKATRPSGEFRWDILVDSGESPPGSGAQGEARFQSQFWTANVSPSERYALSLPGSLKYRISPLDNTYDNLTIAGDWTACGFSAGCVEAAVISGRLAAHALSGAPRLEEIIGFDHP